MENSQLDQIWAFQMLENVLFRAPGAVQMPFKHFYDKLGIVNKLYINICSVPKPRELPTEETFYGIVDVLQGLSQKVDKFDALFIILKQYHI